MTSTGAGGIGKFVAWSWLVDFVLARTLPYLTVPLMHVIAVLYGLGWAVLHLRGTQAEMGPPTDLWLQVAVWVTMLCRLLSVAAAAYLLPSRLGGSRRRAGFWLGITIILGELPRLLWPQRLPYWMPLLTAILPLRPKDLLPDIALQHEIWPLATVLALALPVCLLVGGRRLPAPARMTPGRSGAAAA
jgi:hypothetical protein